MDKGAQAGRSRAAWIVGWFVITGFGALQALASRYDVAADNVSYLNISDLYLSGHWGAAANGYWSPAYPMLLALSRGLLHPAPSAEAPVVHLLNFLLYLGCFAAFRAFVVQLAASVEEFGGWRLTFERPIEVGIAVLVFLYGTLVLSDLNAGADLLVAMFVFAAMSLVLAARRRNAIQLFLCFGATMALGYYAKTFMFPLSLVVIAACGTKLKPFRINSRATFAAFAGFVMVAAPQVISSSKLAGRPSFGDTGVLAYAGKVNGVTRWWTGDPPGSGTPVNPVRLIHRNPDAYSFISDRPSTSYPFWDTPAYWLEGISPKFSLTDQARAVTRSVRAYFGVLGILIATYLLALVWRASRPRVSFAVATSLLAFLLYGLVHAESRFFTAWVPVLFLSAVCGISFRETSQRWFYNALAGGLLICVLPLLSESIGNVRYAAGVVTGYTSSNRHWEVAQSLHASGIARGSRLASVGRAFDGYWARLAGVQIAMEVNEWDAHAYWAAPIARRAELHQVFREAGAAGVVFSEVPAEQRSPHLVPLGSGYYLLPIY